MMHALQGLRIILNWIGRLRGEVEDYIKLEKMHALRHWKLPGFKLENTHAQRDCISHRTEKDACNSDRELSDSMFEMMHALWI